MDRELDPCSLELINPSKSKTWCNRNMFPLSHSSLWLLTRVSDAERIHRGKGKNRVLPDEDSWCGLAG